jgi:hypothetical protein
MQSRGTPISNGTAFVMQAPRCPILITNRHNVTGCRQDTGQPLFANGNVPDSMVITHNRKGHLGEWIQRTEPLYDGETPRWKEHPTLGKEADFVALPLTQLDDVELFPYDVTGARILVGPADIVSVIGFPFGLQAGGSLAVWATGFVASEPDINFRGLPLFLIDCRSRPGQSGSAVIAYRNGGAIHMEDGSTAIISKPVWRLLGIYSGRINEQSDLGFVWKTNAVKELVDTIV